MYLTDFFYDNISMPLKLSMNVACRVVNRSLFPMEENHKLALAQGKVIADAS